MAVLQPSWTDWVTKEEVTGTSRIAAGQFFSSTSAMSILTAAGGQGDAKRKVNQVTDDLKKVIETIEQELAATLKDKDKDKGWTWR